MAHDHPDCARCTGERSSLAFQLDQSNKARDSLRELVKTMTAQANDRTTAVADLGRQVTELETVRDMLVRDRDHLVTARAEARFQLKQALESRDDHRRRADAEREDVANARRQLQYSDRVAGELATQNMRLRVEKAKLRDERDAARRELEAIAAEDRPEVHLG
jgi:chromosome segregation ATPase